MFRTRCAALMCVLLLSGCGGRTAAAPSAVAAPGGTFASSHFIFQYTALDADNITEMAGALEAQYERIVSDLGAGDMPIVNVTFYLDHAVLASATQAVAGPLPSWSAGLVTGQNQIHLMSPNAPAWGPLDRMVSNLIHEFAHCVSLHVNPRIANNPRWLWESVAIYEARQPVDLRTVSYMVSLIPPSFETLSSIDNTRVYDVGYSIGEFVVARWGQRALPALVAANGDTAAVLGLPLADFQRDWFTFTRQRYGF